MARQVSGQLYLRGNIYWLRYQVHGKIFQQSLKVTTKAEAKIERDKVIHPLKNKDEAERLKTIQLALGGAEAAAKEYDAQQIEKKRHKILLSEAWDEYDKDKTRPQSGDIQLGEYKRFWDKFEEWLKTKHPDKLYMEEITPQDAEDFLNFMENDVVISAGRKPKKKKEIKDKLPDKDKKVIKGVGANRFNKYLRGLKLIFRVLAKKCNGMVNPFGEFKGKPLDTKHHRPLTEEELMKVCQTAEGELKLLLAIGLYTGFRISDAALLKWPELNIKAGHIIKFPSKTKRTGKAVKIPLHMVLAQMFAEIPKEERKEYVLPGMAESYLKDGGASIAKMIRKHFVSCGIETNRDDGLAKKTALVTFHSLRHTLINLMAQKGVSLATVRQIAGHRSEEVQRAYIHEDSGAVQTAINLLPSITGDNSIDTHVVTRTDKERIQEALQYITKSKKISKKKLKEILSG